MIVLGKVKQDAQRRDLAAPTRARKISHHQCYAAAYNSLSHPQLGEVTGI
jgi:hypothetical protein